MASPLPTRPRITAEESAREALEERTGRELSDEEWKTAKARLLAYVRLLKSWEQKELAR